MKRPTHQTQKEERQWRTTVRLGVHLGDVVEEADSDLMGDGVNIAARLEGIAQPGAICLSEGAYRQVKGRLDLSRPNPAQEHRRTDPGLFT
jgi:adenylate cyclase